MADIKIDRVQFEQLARDSTLRELMGKLAGSQSGLVGEMNKAGKAAGQLSEDMGSASDALDHFSHSAEEAGSAGDLMGRLMDDAGKKTKKAAEDISRESGLIGKSLATALVSGPARGFSEFTYGLESAAKNLVLNNRAMFAAAGVFGLLSGAVSLAIDGIKDLFAFMAQGTKDQEATAALGVRLGEGFSGARVAAINMGTSFETFTKLIADFGPDLATAFGSANEGAKALASVGNEFQRGSSSLRDDLFKLGYSTDQINEGAALFFTLNKNNNLLSKMNTLDQTRATANLLKEIDQLAFATGQSRAEIENQLKAQAKNPDIFAALADVPDAMQTAARGVFAELQTGGKAFTEIGIAAFTGNASQLSEATKPLLGVLPGLYERMEGLSTAVKNGSISQDDAAAETQKIIASYSGNIDQLKLLAQTNPALRSTIMETVEAIQLANRNLSKAPPSPFDNAYKALMADIDAILGDFKGIGLEFRDAIVVNIQPFIHKLSEALKENEPSIRRALKGISETISGWVNNFVNDVSGQGGKDFGVVLKDTFTAIVNAVKDLPETLSELYDSFKQMSENFTQWRATSTLAKTLGLGLSAKESDKYVSKKLLEKFENKSGNLTDVEGQEFLELYDKLSQEAKKKIDEKLGGVSRYQTIEGTGFDSPGYVQEHLELGTTRKAYQDFRQGERQQYAEGGIASGPSTGFVSLLHGTEAVVPLPDGRSIPVDIGTGVQDAITGAMRANNSGSENMAAQLAMLNSKFEDMMRIMQDISSHTQATAVGVR